MLFQCLSFDGHLCLDTKVKGHLYRRDRSLFFVPSGFFNNNGVSPVTLSPYITLEPGYTFNILSHDDESNCLPIVVTDAATGLQEMGPKLDPH